MSNTEAVFLPKFLPSNMTDEEFVSACRSWDLPADILARIEALHETDQEAAAGIVATRDAINALREAIPDTDTMGGDISLNDAVKAMESAKAAFEAITKHADTIDDALAVFDV